jgi:hypothetical protein
MTDFGRDQGDTDAIRETVREELDEAMAGAARISEFTVDLPHGLEARRPMSEAQLEVSVALNTLARLLDRRAEEAARAREARWEGLSDAATMARNMAGDLGLPQLPAG